METKKWYLSKTMWSAVLAVAFAAYNAIGQPLLEGFGIALPQVPEFIYAMLGAFGIYSRKVAVTRIV